MSAELSPGLVLIFGAILVPLLRGHLRSAYMLALPVAAFALLLSLPEGNLAPVSLFGMDLVTLRIDRLSTIFGYMFLVAVLLGILYQLHVRDTVQHVAALVYSGSAIGAVFAGDLVTLFLFWEGTAIASVFLIWASRTERSYAAGMRYLIIQIGSGVLLLAGTMIHYRQTGSIAFETFNIDTLAGLLIFLSFGIKCAFPLLHSWLQDAYPEATVTGTVMLSAFTTKLAVYTLIRGFAGTEVLVLIGAIMAVFPVAYAIAENDLRRVLAYSLNSQLGIMVVGIGIGTDLAINGAVAHAAASVVYQGLLFMAMGAVLFRTGTARASELGGLYRSMPWTTVFCIVGAASISALPLFSGFVSKAMTISAAMYEGHFWAWIALLAASTGAFIHSGIKIPFFAFFGKPSDKRPQEAPLNMLAAMATAGVLCIAIGVFPGTLNALLPFSKDYAAYTGEHVLTQMQLLMFAALAFTVLMRTKVYPLGVNSTLLDTDWLYRRGLARVVLAMQALVERLASATMSVTTRQLSGLADKLHHYHGPGGKLARTWPTGAMAFWTTVLLATYLVAYFV